MALRVRLCNTFLAFEEPLERGSSRRCRSCDLSSELVRESRVEAQLRDLSALLNHNEDGAAVHEPSSHNGSSAKIHTKHGTSSLDSTDAGESSDSCDLDSRSPSKDLSHTDGPPRGVGEKRTPEKARVGGNGTRFAHGSVPRTTDLAKEHGSREVTTVMVRNIPSNYAQRDLLDDLAELGLGGTLDFLYVPLDKNTMTNVGYAFVNFVRPSFATRCMELLQGFRFQRNRRDRGRLAAASAAHLQGLEANLKHYEKAAIMNARQKQRRPLVLSPSPVALTGIQLQ